MSCIARLRTLFGLALFSTAIALGSLLASGSDASADTYTVESGDTLSGIASCFNVSVSVLMTLNTEISSPNNIYVGQSLELPANAQPSADSACGLVGYQSGASTSAGTANSESQQSAARCIHTVVSGDTFSSIALAIGVDTNELLALNANQDPKRLSIGTELIVPCGTTSGGAASAETGQQALTAGHTGGQLGNAYQHTVAYEVQPGDGLLLIALRHGLTLDELLRHNGLGQDTVLHPGDILWIPTPDYLVPALHPDDARGVVTTSYTVRSGDTASAIATVHGITTAELIQLNGGLDLNIIIPGQQLNVPWIGLSADGLPGTMPAVEVRRRTYRVERGDTFQSIAAAHGLSMDELRELNPSPFGATQDDLLVIGQRLYLPGTIDAPVVAEDRMLWDADQVQYAAAALGVTPHTLISNHSWLESDQWLGAGTSWRVPIREGLLVTVQPGDTLQAIADRHGVDINLILSDPAHGVDDPNELVISQEIILPLWMPNFAWPAGGEITDPFGLCRNSDCSYRHKGLDLALDLFVPIVAAADGVVTFVGGDSALGLGWYIEIEHEYGWRTTYAHLSEFAVYQGQHVSQGDVIGYNGNTGYSTGPHLHFEVHHNDWYVDPLVVLP